MDEPRYDRGDTWVERTAPPYPLGFYPNNVAQLLLPMALAGMGTVTATKLSLHARTNMEVITKVLPVRFATIENEDFTGVEILCS